MLHILTDPGADQLIPLTRIPSIGSPLIPVKRSGGRIAISTIYRWATRGCRGVKLEVLRAGGVTCTTRSALLRFYEGVTRKGEGLEVLASPASPHRVHADVDRQLDSIFNAKNS